MTSLCVRLFVGIPSREIDEKKAFPVKCKVMGIIGQGSKKKE